MSSPHRVLFVEDYPPFKRSFERLLTRKFGVDVTVAESGEEAIGQFGAIDPELVILDLGLPGVGGHETLQVIRALPNGESVPVIVLTGSNDPESKNAVAHLDIDGYVLKENATDEFTDVMLSIFSDLRVTSRERSPSSAEPSAVNDAFGVAGLRNLAGGTPGSRRTVRVLMPREVVDRRPNTGPWARQLVQRALVALPRIFRVS